MNVHIYLAHSLAFKEAKVSRHVQFVLSTVTLQVRNERVVALDDDRL